MKWKKGCSLFTNKAFDLNALTIVDYLKRLQEIALNVFEWKNLPPTVDERFLELTLFMDGMAIFYFDDVAERYLALQTMIGGNLDVYRIPKRRRAYAVNGYNYQLTSNDSVIIFNNYLREPSFPTIQLYAARLAEIERTIDVNIKAQKTPIIVKTSESQRMTMKNLLAQYDGNEPFIYGDKNLDLTGIDSLNIASPFVADKLQIIKKQYWAEALTYLGVENYNTDKKERLVTDEVQSNMGAVEMQRYVRLNARRQACRQINQMFGLDIWVDYRSDYMTVDNDTNTTEREVIDGERVYDGTTIPDRKGLPARSE